jgi:hypothetical protein
MGYQRITVITTQGILVIRISMNENTILALGCLLRYQMHLLGRTRNSAPRTSSKKICCKVQSFGTFSFLSAENSHSIPHFMHLVLVLIYLLNRIGNIIGLSYAMFIYIASIGTNERSFFIAAPT